MATIWKEKLQKELIKNYGDKKASALTKKYANTFPHSYMDECSAEIAANDLAYIEKLSAADPLGVYFILHQSKNTLCMSGCIYGKNPSRFRIYCPC